MGMYDEIRIDVILPGETSITNEWFQTKSLENAMAKYVITDNGQLCEENWDYTWIEDSSRFLGGYMKKNLDTYHRKYLTDFHGDIRFYSSHGPMENLVWRDYYARFTDGKLTRLWFEDTQN